MRYDDLIVLLPSHSLEDFPNDLPEEPAASLLNAFAVLWHPALLATAGVVPSWQRADEPPEVVQNRLVIVPQTAADWLPGGWLERARENGANVVTDCITREEMIAAALGPLESEATADPELVADFLAFGTCQLQLELLTRHMHHFSDVDQARLQREIVPAAKAAMANDAVAARTHLHAAFELLMNGRERFYPIECYLIDLCLLIPDLADDHLARLVESRKPVNYLTSGADWETIAQKRPDIVDQIRTAWRDGQIDLAGGEYREAPTPPVAARIGPVGIH